MVISADIDITVRYYSYLNGKAKNERINVWHEVLLVSNFFHYLMRLVLVNFFFLQSLLSQPFTSIKR